MQTKRQHIRNLITAVIAIGLGFALNATPAQAAPPCTFLIMDEDSIDNTNPGYYLPPNTGKGDNGQPFTDSDVNDNIAKVGLRTPLSFFNNPANFGRKIVIRSGQVGDEALFAPKVIPDSWRDTGPTNDGLINYIGKPCQPFPHNVGEGLGQGDDPEALLDKIPLVTPLRATGLSMLIGKTICALVYDGDVSINYGPLTGNLQGANLGVVAFKLLEVKKAIDFSDSTLPLLTVQIVNPCRAFVKKPVLFLDAPEPTSSSEPFDVDPSGPGQPGQ